VLGPRCFVAYAEGVTNIFEQHHARHHLLADDMQGIKHSRPSNVRDITAGLGACVKSVNNWCTSKHLQLNTKKTEVMWFGSATNLRKILSMNKNILLGSDILSPSPVVRDLGVFFDSELNTKSHISRIVRTYFYGICAVLCWLGQETTARLVSAELL